MDPYLTYKQYNILHKKIDLQKLVNWGNDLCDLCNEVTERNPHMFWISKTNNRKVKLDGCQKNFGDEHLKGDINLIVLIA